MSIHVEWGDETQTYLIMHLHKGWKAEDVIQGVRWGQDLAGSSSPDVLIDLSQAPRIPQNIIRHLRQFDLDAILADREIVICGVNTYDIAFIKNILYVLLPQFLPSLVFKPTLKEARNYLQHKHHAMIR